MPRPTFSPLECADSWHNELSQPKPVTGPTGGFISDSGCENSLCHESGALRLYSALPILPVLLLVTVGVLDGGKAALDFTACL